MKRRKLRLNDFSELLTEVHSLRESGYQRVGNWDLGQIVEHLGTTIKMSLDGFPFGFPFFLRPIIKAVLFKSILLHKPVYKQFSAPKSLQPNLQVDPTKAIAQLETLVDRMEKRNVPFVPKHPVFGKITPEEWREFHLWHAEHHLSFLLPA